MPGSISHDVAGPEIFTFLNKTTFLSVKTRKMVENVLNKSNDRNPDVHDMLIYNDFYGYAVLDLIDTTSARLHTKVQEKEWDEAMLVAEALTHFGRYILNRVETKRGLRTVLFLSSSQERRSPWMPTYVVCKAIG
ncbi:hypothetical protein F5050DRAFT_1894107, partial [Lentinula boryana]